MTEEQNVLEKNIRSKHFFQKGRMKRNQKRKVNLQCNVVKTKHLPIHQSTRDDLPLLFKISFINVQTHDHLSLPEVKH